MMRLRATALDYLGNVLVLQTDGGLLPWPSTTQSHAPGALGELVFHPGTVPGANEQRIYGVERKGPLVLLRDDAGLVTALMVPPGEELGPRVAVELVMPDVEIDEGAENTSEAGPEDACPCPNVTPAQVAASFLLGICPQ
ncbi:hypothetical protein OV203_46615 [Nannocystis sp. ILAH1]|uniref:hypothetical protein n=1 Tax=Nannocystis sp. ILAH1 TaxID=2996789 RepID=UPI00226FFA4F|nr:hypothetical protein [Nannocystis sp. ILAH1]MCY0994688.1 hypothetical protein [Nannocystis sp. ILAH1]